MLRAQASHPHPHQYTQSSPTAAARVAMRRRGAVASAWLGLVVMAGMTPPASGDCGAVKAVLAATFADKHRPVNYCPDFNRGVGVCRFHIWGIDHGQVNAMTCKKLCERAGQKCVAASNGQQLCDPKPNRDMSQQECTSTAGNMRTCSCKSPCGPGEQSAPDTDKHATQACKPCRLGTHQPQSAHFSESCMPWGTGFCPAGQYRIAGTSITDSTCMALAIDGGPEAGPRCPYTNTDALKQAVKVRHLATFAQPLPQTFRLSHLFCFVWWFHFPGVFLHENSIVKQHRKCKISAGLPPCVKMYVNMGAALQTFKVVRHNAAQARDAKKPPSQRTSDAKAYGAQQMASQSHIVAFPLSKWRQNLDLRCVLLSDPSTYTTGCKTRLESGM